MLEEQEYVRCRNCDCAFYTMSLEDTTLENISGSLKVYDCPACNLETKSRLFKDEFNDREIESFKLQLDSEEGLENV